MRKLLLCILCFISFSCSSLFVSTLEYDSVMNLKVEESFADGKTVLKVSGLCASSASCVRKIYEERQAELICMKVDVSPFHAKGASGSFEYSIEIPDGVSCLVFGKNKYEIWSSSPFRNASLIQGGIIPAGTKLSLCDSAFSDTIYEFLSDKDGIVKDYLVDYVKESESFPDGARHTEKSSGTFLYEPDTGKVTVDGEYVGNIAFLPSGEPFVLYKPTEVYVRAFLFEDGLKSAWVKDGQDGEPAYKFYEDGTFKGPLYTERVLPADFAEDGSAENDLFLKDRYTEKNSVISLRYHLKPTYSCLLHDGNRLYEVVDYIRKCDWEIYLNDSPPEWL